MSENVAGRAGSDRNLLFGVLALQIDFSRRDALVQAMNAWVLDKGKPLGQILQKQGALAADHRAWLEAGVEKHLAAHGNDPQKGLAAVSSVGSAKKELAQIADPDLQASLVHVSTGKTAKNSSSRTRSPSSSSASRTGGRRPGRGPGAGRSNAAPPDAAKKEILATRRIGA